MSFADLSKIKEKLHSLSNTIADQHQRLDVQSRKSYLDKTEEIAARSDWQCWFHKLSMGGAVAKMVSSFLTNETMKGVAEGASGLMQRASEYTAEWNRGVTTKLDGQRTVEQFKLDSQRRSKDGDEAQRINNMLSQLIRQFGAMYMRAN